RDLLGLRAVGPRSAGRGADQQPQSQCPDSNCQPAHEHGTRHSNALALPATSPTCYREHSPHTSPRTQEKSSTRDGPERCRDGRVDHLFPGRCARSPGCRSWLERKSRNSIYLREQAKTLQMCSARYLHATTVEAV